MVTLKRVALALVAALAWSAAAAPAGAETIAIIGTGQVAGALGPALAARGHEIVYGSREPEREEVKALLEQTGPQASVLTPPEAAAGADIVVLAVPGLAVEAITRSLGDLSGKIVIDPTNPLRQGADGGFELSGPGSNAELIQAAAPEAYVVKAFNTLSWRTMADPATGGGPVSIPLVGDSAEAKRKVAGLVESLGLEAIDVGPLRHARYVEGMLILWINNRYYGGEPFDYYLRKLPPG